MLNDDMKKLVNGINEKLGEETASTIADDLAKIITDNANMNTQNEDKDKEITRLKNLNESIVTANSSLLQQVANSYEEKPKKNENKEKPKSFKSLFNEKGEFI